MNFHEVFDLYFAVMNSFGFFYFLLEINMNLKISRFLRQNI